VSKIWVKVGALNVARQLCELRQLYPHGIGRIARNRLQWQCALQPSAFSRTYRVEIKYRLGNLPVIVVWHPCPRELSGGRKPPHTYAGEADPLCVFYPAAQEWNSSMPIARTIVPWSCEWLLHFEAWLFTGIWEGGGTSHALLNETTESQAQIINQRNP